MTKSRRELDRDRKALEKALALIKVLSIVAFIIHGLFIVGVSFVFILFFTSLGGGYGSASEKTILVVIAAIIGVLCLSAFNGVISLRKGKKKGFFYFATGSLVLVAVLFTLTYFTWNQQPQLLGVFIGLVLIFLVLAFGSQKKYLK